MMMLPYSRSLLHILGELVLVAAGAWGLFLQFGRGLSPLMTTQWFGPLALLATGLFLAILPLSPARNAAWIHDWARPQVGLASLLWSFGVCGCLYSLWLQYSLEFNIRPVLMLAPGFAYWFLVTCPGGNIQQRNIERAAEREAAGDGKVEEVRSA